MSSQPYSERTHRPHDFEVSYRFFRPDEGGRASGVVFQGYRCDFVYEGEDVAKTGVVYMIWPQFEDGQSNLIDDKIQVPTHGMARMFIISENMRKFHQERIKVGVRGFFVEGRHKVAEVTVTKVVGLQ